MKRARFAGLLFVLALLATSQGMTDATMSPGVQSSLAAILAADIASSDCSPLPPPSGNVVNVDTVSELVYAVDHATPGTTIRIADGTYSLGSGDYLWIDTPNLTIRSASGNREAVILDGNYQTTEIISISASNVTIADLTLREALYHPIHVMSTADADTNNTLIYNVHVIDPGQQAIKINPTPGGHYADNGVIACSHIELTDAGRARVPPITPGYDCYTGGIDAHQSRDWVIRDNLIEGFWCPAGLAEHGIHLWVACRDPIVERNVLRNNARGIGFGMATSGTGRVYPDNACPYTTGYVDHYRGVIRNNFISADAPDLFASDSGFDCGICLWNACSVQTFHNTVYTADPANTFSSIGERFDLGTNCWRIIASKNKARQLYIRSIRSNPCVLQTVTAGRARIYWRNLSPTRNALSIEWRFANTRVELTNNLVNHTMRQRDGANATPSGNVTNAQASWFVNANGGDLHLVSTATNAIDQVSAPSGVTDDVDGDPRPMGGLSDVGADEYGAPPPSAVTDLRVTSVITTTGVLTATLRWTPPGTALTTTLRYSHTLITEANWNSAPLFGTVSGAANVYTGSVPYTSGSVYFALQSQNAAGGSALSNNAFWPHQDVFLPVIIRNAS